MFRIAAFLLGTAPLALLTPAARAQTAPDPAVAAAQAQAPSDAAVAAEQASTADPAAPDATTPTPDIVVVGTAGAGTRRQEASFAVTTLGSAAIERAAPTSTADLLRSVPGVAVESSGGQNGANIFVRGYPSGGDAPFVTFQFDGVPVFPPPTLSFLENSQLVRLDETVQRVEAVRGGTGSLFSNGQPGLTVNIVPRIGGSTFKGFAKVGVATYGNARGDAWVSGPIDENTTFMVGGFYAQGDGIRSPRFLAEQGGQITANIHHDFAGRGSAELYVRYLNDHGQWLLPIPINQNGSRISGYPGFDSGTGTLLGPETRVVTNLAGRRIDLGSGRGARIINTGANLDYELTPGLRLRERLNFLGGNADTNGLVPDEAPLSAAALAVALGGAGARVGSLTYANGGGAVAGGANAQVLRAGAWSVKKKISSFVSDSGLEWTAGINKLTGGFYYANYTTHDDWSLGNDLLLTATPNARRLSLVLADGRVAANGQGFTAGPGYQVSGAYTGNDYALYAVDELRLTEALRVDGGVRWQRHEIAGSVRTPDRTVDLDGNPNTLYNNAVSVLGAAPQQIGYGDSAWSFTVGANYDVTRSFGAFVRYSRGHSFPQFDDLRGLPAAAIAAHTGTAVTASVDTIEGGLKLTTTYLNLYATAFHNTFNGLATTSIINGVPTSSTGGAQATGLELEGVVRPTTWFSLTGSGTYLDSTYRNYFTGNGTINDTGNRTQRQPRWSWRLSPAIDVDLGGGYKPSIFAALQYTGDRFSDPENQQLLPSYYQLDVGAAIDLGRFRLQVTGNNVTDTLGLTEGNPRIIGSQGTGTILARPILGRSFLFSAAVKF